MNYIINDSSLILFINNEPLKVEKTNRLYPRVLKAFALPKDQQEDAVLEILKPQLCYGQNGFELVDGEIWYQNEKLPEPLKKKVLNIQKEGLPVVHFEKFWERLRDNPNRDSADQLIDFLAYKELPITEEGYLIAYKGVQDDYYSVSGNVETVVICGVVNNRGQILNRVGSVVEIERSQVSSDRSEGCHNRSLHLGSLDYARSWGKKTVIVRVDPSDVVSVPECSSFQKCRVCKYEVIGELESEISEPVVDEGGKPVKEEAVKVYSAAVKKINQYLINRKAEGKTVATVRNLMKSFNPAKISRIEVQSALQELGYSWNSAGEIKL